MAQIIVSLLAQSDTANILTELVREAGSAVAARHAARFEALYDRLAAHPESGPVRPALGPLVRIGIVSSYIVIYEHDRASGRVTILRIVHGRRKLTGEFLQGHKA